MARAVKGAVKGKRRIVPHARRRELKTDYRKRLKMLRSGKPRVVVRKSLNNMLCQVIGYKAGGDVCLVTADSRELARFGWKAGRGNIPAAYLTGLLCGKKARGKNISAAVLDIGMRTSTPANRLYAALRGVIDGGLEVAHSGEILPDDERTKGSHISSYAEWLQKENKPEYERRFSSYVKSKVDPKSLPRHFDEVKAKILKSKL